MELEDPMSETAQNTTGRYLCIHGHFYQPPRENPWLEVVETQDSAAPYHDWNERITAECYGHQRRLAHFERRQRDRAHRQQLCADQLQLRPDAALVDGEACAGRVPRDSRGGQGELHASSTVTCSALAQVYNHIIMPLASERDKRTQIVWGIADFERRFGRKPEGMWLAETAVDTPTLELLAEHGIVYTILAPHQCAAVRPLREVDEIAGEVTHEEAWHGTPDASVDTRQPYLVQLKSGRTISIFFYDGPRSRAIAFERLLDSGEGFARRMAGGFHDEPPASDGSARPQLVHVATDGESYGHHHRYGEMALSYALRYTEENELATLTNYGEFLAHFPPQWEARIVEDTSWSCAHGVERWRSDCGCNGGRAGWNQRWRAPLRAALDGLRDALLPLVREAALPLFRDHEVALDHYVAVILDREQRDAFLAEQATHVLSATQRRTALKLMELERYAQLMYTSCGWFFDDISGIETVQIIAYAARALELATELFGARGTELEARFVETLRQAESNVQAEGNGETIYRRHGRGLQVGLEQVAAHYAISSIFASYPEQAELFAFVVRRLAYEVTTSGRGRLMTGEAEVRSQLTEDCERMVYAVLHFGDQNIAAVVKQYDASQAEEHARFLTGVREAVMRADLPGVIRLFDGSFGSQSYSIRSLFNDEQRRVIQQILSGTLAEVEDSLLHLYEDHASLLHFLNQTEVPRPSALGLAAGFAINVLLRRAIEAEPLDPAQVRAALALADADQITLDVANLNFVMDRRMTQAMLALQAAPRSFAVMEQAIAVATAAHLLPFAANIWQAQNLWYEIWKQTHAGGARRANDGVADEAMFAALGGLLKIASAQLTSAERVGTSR